MKKLAIFLFLFVCATQIVFGQFVPQGFSYQCVVRNASNQPLINQNVPLVFSIRSGSANGPIVYSERHDVATGTTGLVNLVIGKGQALQGQFTNVNWAGGSKFFQVYLDEPGNPVDLGTTEFQSVPYAMHALSAANSSAGDNWGNQTAKTGPTLIGNGTTVSPLQIAPQDALVGQVLKWNGQAWLPQDDISSTGVNGGTVTSIQTSAGLTGGPITTSGTIGLSNTGVPPGAYGSATEIPVITVDAQGRITNVWTAVPSPGTVGIVGGTGIGVQQNGLSFTVTNTGDTNPSDDLTQSTSFNGDVTGTSADLQIKPSVIGSVEIVNQSIQGVDINKMNANTGEVLKWNGAVWAPAIDETGITSVSVASGPGIVVSGTSPDFVISNSGDTNPADDLTNTAQAGGDLSGTFNNLQIVPLSVGTPELANGSVTAAKLDDMNAANGQILKWNGTVWAPAPDQVGTTTVTAGSGITVVPIAGGYQVVNAGDTNASDDLTLSTLFDGDVSGPSDDLQLGNGVVRAENLDQMGAAAGQVLKWNGTIWAPASDLTGTGGGTYSAGAGIQLVGTAPNQSIVNIGDLDETNELQQISITGNTLTLSQGGGSVTLPTGGGTANTYAQGTGIAIAGTAPNFTISNTGDLSATNEIQVLSLAGNTLALSNGGGSVTLPTGGGTANNYTAGNGIVISGTAPNYIITNSGDLSATNEIQNLSLSGTTLSLSGSTSTVDLATLVATNQWGPVGAHLRNTNAGNVLIGKSTNAYGRLQVESNATNQPAAVFNALPAVGDSAAIVARHNGAGPAAKFSSATGPSLITAGGSVGINTNAPSAQLHVVGATNQVRVEGPEPTITLATQAVPLGNGPKEAYIQHNSRGLVIGSNSDTVAVNLMPGGKASVMTNPKTGNVGIGNTNNEPYALKVFMENQGLNLENAATGDDWEFWVNDQGQLVLYNSKAALGTPAGVFDVSGVYTASDKRLKEGIQPMPANAMSKIMALQPVTYQYLNQPQQMPGLIAQDVQTVLPELVRSVKGHNTDIEYLTVNYSALTPLIIKALQEQQIMIEQLAKENTNLRAILDQKK